MWRQAARTALEVALEEPHTGRGGRCTFSGSSKTVVASCDTLVRDEAVTLMFASVKPAKRP